MHGCCLVRESCHIALGVLGPRAIRELLRHAGEVLLRCVEVFLAEVMNAEVIDGVGNCPRSRIGLLHLFDERLGLRCLVRNEIASQQMHLQL